MIKKWYHQKMYHQSTLSLKKMFKKYIQISFLIKVNGIFNVLTHQILISTKIILTYNKKINSILLV